MCCKSNDPIREKANVYEDISTQEDSLKAVGENTAVFAVIPDLLEMTPLRSILKKQKDKGRLSFLSALIRKTPMKNIRICRLDLKEQKHLWIPIYL